MIKQSQATSKVRAPRWPVGLVPWRETVENFLHQIARRLGTQIEIIGVTRSQVDGDTLTFDVPGSAAGEQDHNWYPSMVDATTLRINSGHVNDVPATIGGGALSDDPPPELTVDDEDLNYVCLKVTYAIDTDGTTVTGMSISAREIIANTTGRPADTTTEKYFLLFTWQAGSRLAQWTYWSIGIKAQDDGSATSTPEIITWPLP